jgi:hypothetical protein
VRPSLLRYALVVLAALVALGCHEQPGTKVSPKERLPVEPEDKNRPDGGATDDPDRIDALPWKQPRVPRDPRSDWQIGICHLPEVEATVTYQIPFEWDSPNSDPRCRTRSGDGLVRVVPTVTPLTKEQIGLEDYVAQLAENQPIYTRTTPNGHVTYLTQREVSIAPSDPNVARRMFHTAVVRVDDRIIKLEVSYDVDVRWRFADIANAILGTIEVRENESAD